MTDLLAIRDLYISFQLHDALIEAVRGISFTVPAGGTVALVGESGSGKTVVSQAVLGILPAAGRQPRNGLPARAAPRAGRLHAGA